MPLVQIIACSTRQGRAGHPLAEWIFSVAKERPDMDVEFIDLREIALPIFDEPNHPRLGKYVHDYTKAWSARVARAQGFVFVTPEYNHGYPASIKNAIDHLFHEWHFKPVGFVSYGGVAAGTRAVQALKPVLAALQMIPVVEAVNVPFFTTLIDAEKKFRPDKGLEDAAKLMLDRVAFWIDHQKPLLKR